MYYATHSDHYRKSNNGSGGIRESKGARESEGIIDSIGVTIPSIRGWSVSASHYLKRDVHHCVSVCVTD